MNRAEIVTVIIFIIILFLAAWAVGENEKPTTVPEVMVIGGSSASHLGGLEQ